MFAPGVRLGMEPWRLVKGDSLYSLFFRTRRIRRFGKHGRKIKKHQHVASDLHRYLELQQYRFDCRRFEVVSTGKILPGRSDLIDDSLLMAVDGRPYGRA